MPLNRACIGKIYPPTSLDVTVAAIADYARACNENNPCYFASSRPDGIVAPPLFAAVATWLPLITAVMDPALSADLLRLLHTAQEMHFSAPIRPGDRITTTACITAIDAAAGGESLSVELRAANQHDVEVNYTRFTGLIRGRRGPLACAESSREQAAEGAPMVAITQPIDPDQTFRYAEASGDRNPIHTDANVARMVGLPGIIVHGLCTMAFAGRVIIDELCARDPRRLKRLAAHFSRPLFPGDSITTSLWPQTVPASFSFVTTNSQGLAVITGGAADISP